MSALTARQLSEIAQFEIGAAPGSPIQVIEQVNQAGEALVAAFPWRWLEIRSATLRPRASIDLTDATWVEGTLTLSKPGAFTNYSFLSADTVVISGGTGATVGTYQVASRVDANSITLTTSIGAAASGIGDTEGTMPNDQIELPTDFDLQSITAIGMTNGLIGAAELTSGQQMIDLRSFPGLGTTVGFWALVRYVREVNVQPVQRLEQWPKSGSNDEALVIYYRSGWREPATDTEVLSVPNWCNSLFIEMFKAVVLGHEEPEGGSVDARLSALRKGVLWNDAVRRDAMVQPPMGPAGGCWMDGYENKIGRYSIPYDVPVP